MPLQKNMPSRSSYDRILEACVDAEFFIDSVYKDIGKDAKKKFFELGHKMELCRSGLELLIGRENFRKSSITKSDIDNAKKAIKYFDDMAKVMENIAIAFDILSELTRFIPAKYSGVGTVIDVASPIISELASQNAEAAENYSKQLRERIDELERDDDKDGKPNYTDPDYDDGDESNQPDPDADDDGDKIPNKDDPDDDGDKIPDEDDPDHPDGPRPGDIPKNPPVLVDPLVLDLNGNGVRFVSLEKSKAYFDIDNDGVREHVGWIEKSDGFLVLDKNGNGVVDNRTELFGDGKESGFEALKKLDSNRDGKIDAKDKVFPSLRVWIDTNGDGRSTKNELVSLKKVGIDSISLDYVYAEEVRSGNIVIEKGESRGAGGRREVVSVDLVVDQLVSRWETPEGFRYSARSMALPDLNGYGDLKSLRATVTLDPKTAAALSTFIKNSFASSPAKLADLFDGVLYAWAGFDKSDRNARGTQIDGRKIGFLEEFYGQSLARENLSEGEAKFFAAKFDEISDLLLLRVMPQVASSVLSQTINFKTFNPKKVDTGVELLMSSVGWDHETDHLDFNVTAFISVLSDLLPAKAHGRAAVLKSVEWATSKLVHTFAHGSAENFENLLAQGLKGLSLKEVRISNFDFSLLAAFASGASLIVSKRGTATGTQGSDVLEGGTGNDTLKGGEQGDTYVFALGDGQDTIADSGWFADGTDRVLFAAGIDPAQVGVSLADEGSDLVLTIAGTSDQITLDNTITEGA